MGLIPSVDCLNRKRLTSLEEEEEILPGDHLQTWTSSLPSVSSLLAYPADNALNQKLLNLKEFVLKRTFPSLKKVLWDSTGLRLLPVVKLFQWEGKALQGYVKYGYLSFYTDYLVAK